MQLYHRFEYNRHRWSLLSLQLCTCFSLAYTIVGVSFVTLVASCYMSELEYLTKKEFAENDICMSVFTNAAKFTP